MYTQQLVARPRPKYQVLIFVNVIIIIINTENMLYIVKGIMLISENSTLYTIFGNAEW